MNTLRDAMDKITQQLTASSDSARLDAELLISTIVQQSRAWLYAHLEQPLSDEDQSQLKQLITRRSQGEPMAYILGYKEFWGLKFKVTPDVLIPRPETEHLLEWILVNFSETSSLLAADLGVGCGAIALSLAVERSSWRIDATDQSTSALEIAKQNASTHNVLNVNFYQGTWCDALPQKNYALLVSNPPYIPDNDPHLQQLSYEPAQALRSGTDGLDAIREIINQAPDYLAPAGYLALEHGYNQAREVAKLFRKNGFSNIQCHFDLSNQPRFTTANYRAC